MNRIETLYSNVFSQKNVEQFEKKIMFLAVGGFIVHLLLIFFENYYGIDIFSSKTNLSSNPISALYTPFTFILVYEAFLLIHYLPRSFTTSVAKEYEIISLVLIRKIFKDIPEISLDSSNILNANNLQLLYKEYEHQDPWREYLIYYLSYSLHNKNLMSVGGSLPRSLLSFSRHFMLSKKDSLHQIKMIDFGLSKDFTGMNFMNTMSGSPYYIAPEVFI